MAPGRRPRLGAMRSGVALACPQQAVPLRPSPPEGRSVVPALDPDRANATRGRYVEVTSFGVGPPVMGRSRPRPRAGSPDHEQAKEAAMSVVSFALALPLVLLFVAMLIYGSSHRSVGVLRV